MGRRILTQRRSKLAAAQQAFGLVLDHFVIGGVEELDDLAVFDQGLRNPDLLAEAHRDPLGQGRFAVARRAVEKQARAGIDRRAQAFEQLGVDRDVGKGLGQLAALGGLGPNRLGLHAEHVVAQRHRRGADVGAGVQVVLGPHAALFGQRVVVVAQRRRAAVHQHLPRAQVVEDRLEDAKRQAEMVGDGPAAGRADDVQVLADQPLDERRRQAGFFQAAGLRRPKGLVRKQRGQQALARVAGSSGRHESCTPKSRNQVVLASLGHDFSAKRANRRRLLTVAEALFSPQERD